MQKLFVLDEIRRQKSCRASFWSIDSSDSIASGFRDWSIYWVSGAGSYSDCFTKMSGPHSIPSRSMLDAAQFSWLHFAWFGHGAFLLTSTPIGIINSLSVCTIGPFD